MIAPRTISTDCRRLATPIVVTEREASAVEPEGSTVAVAMRPIVYNLSPSSARGNGPAMRRLFWMPALLVLAACYDLFYAPLPDGAVRMAPLPVYAEWWRMTEQCSALGGDYSDIE